MAAALSNVINQLNGRHVPLASVCIWSSTNKDKIVVFMSDLCVVASAMTAS